MTINNLQAAINDATKMHGELASCFDQISAIAKVAAEALSHGNKLLFCGNGGSAAESQHIATEFVVRLSSKRNRRALAAIALTTDTSLLTACANDMGFEKIFARQIEANMNKGDVLFLLSTSGASANLLEAAQTAHAQQGITVSFLGKDTTPLDKFTDHALHIPSLSGQRVQEAHLLCGHVLVEMVEDLLIQQFNQDEHNSARMAEPIKS
jgi:D-sedoheptulose 7-phosphate isomerase